jgi:hypothetical protein
MIPGPALAGLAPTQAVICGAFSPAERPSSLSVLDYTQNSKEPFALR